MADVKLLLTLCILLRTFLPSDALSVCCNTIEMSEETHVICSGCRLLGVPKDLPSNTTVLDLSNNNLASLERHTFPDLQMLKILYLQRNKLVRITSGAFDNVPNIEKLDLTDNKLEQSSIDMNVFEILKKLRTLIIPGNNFHIRKVYPEQTLSSISNLSVLVMDIFEGFVFRSGFWNQPYLQHLYLSFQGNGTVTLFNDSFEGLKRSNIKELSIAAPFRKIETNTLASFGNLIKLKWENIANTLTIDDALEGLYGIRGRTMDSLSIIGFRYRFTTGEGLRKSDMFNLGTICVKKLYLIGNAISTIGIDAMTAWTSKTCIKELDLSKNMFYLPQPLTLLGLFSSLTRLLVRHTAMKILRKRSTFMRERTFFLPTNLTYVDIRELDMTGIDCSEVNPNMFAETPLLSRLTVRQCNIERVLSLNIPAIFKGLHHLSIVDVSSNNLHFIHKHLLTDQKKTKLTK